MFQSRQSTALTIERRRSKVHRTIVLMIVQFAIKRTHNGESFTWIRPLGEYRLMWQTYQSIRANYSSKDAVGFDSLVEFARCWCWCLWLRRVLGWDWDPRFQAEVWWPMNDDGDNDGFADDGRWSAFGDAWRWMASMTMATHPGFWGSWALSTTLTSLVAHLCIKHNQHLETQ